MPTVAYGAPTTDATAVMGRRIAAWLLDLVIWFAIGIAVFAALAERVPTGTGNPDACAYLEATAPDQVSSCLDARDVAIIPMMEDNVFVTSDADGAVQTLVSLGYLIVFIVLQGAVGGSPGKLLLGLRVVRADGRVAGVGRSLGRTLLWIVDGAPWFVPLVGLITGLTSNGHRRVGDMVAGTYVVGRASVGQPVQFVSQAPPPGSTWGAPPPSSWGPPPAGPPMAPPSTSAPPSVPTWAPTSPSTPSADIDTASTSMPPATDPGPGPDIEVGPSPTGFVAPGATPTPEAAAPSGDEGPVLPPPQWDTARNTYIQWDPRVPAWLQWDADNGAWKPIDT